MTADHAVYLLTSAIVLLGLLGLLRTPNLLRKLMSLNILQVAVIAFFILLGHKTGAAPPIATAAPAAARQHANPLPHTLMLTAIVVAVGTTGVALALLIRISRRYGTLDEEELLSKLRGE